MITQYKNLCQINLNEKNIKIAIIHEFNPNLVFLVGKFNYIRCCIQPIKHE